MAQMQANTTSRKTGTIHITRGPKADKPVRKSRTHRIKAEEAQEMETRHDAPPRANESVWITALTGAEGFHRDALGIELAVGLSVFSVKADQAKVGLDAKKALREIYMKAGYACATPQGEDYKTVLRRISVTADLYQHIGGRETIVDWIGDASPRDQVKTIMEHVKGYKFDSINDVLAYVGKPVVTKRPREGTQKATEASDAAKAASAAMSIRNLTSGLKLPDGRVFQHGAMTVAVPLEATYDEVMAIVTDLTVFAATHLRSKEQEAAHAQGATPAVAPVQQQALATA